LPVAKATIQWIEFIASEMGIPSEAVWVRPDSAFRKFGSGHTNVIIWTEKLTKAQVLRLTSAKSAGGPLSMRGKLQRFLRNMQADGYLTKVKPSEALPEDLHPISHLGSRKFCKDCFRELVTQQEEYIHLCEMCCPK
jgi:hypothetical protein